MRRRLALLAALVGATALLAGCGLGGDDEPSSDGGGGTSAPPVLGRSSGSGDAAGALGFPAFATKNTTRVGGADPAADAAGVARAVFPARSRVTRPLSVTVVDIEDWRSAISAAQLMSDPLRSPVLFSRDGDLPAATEAAIEALAPTGSPKAGRAQVIRVGRAAAEPEGRRVTEIAGTDHVALAVAIDRLHTAAAGEPSQAVLVAASERPAFAMPAAGLAAKSGVPVLWTSRGSLPAATRRALAQREQPNIYVVGPADAVAESVLDELRKLGAVERISGADPVANAIAFARYADGRFGWNVVDPGHGLVFASAERPADAAAAAALSATGKYGPLLLLTDANALPKSLENYLLDIQPGYDQDPVRGVYNHGWLMGDEGAISIDVQARIDALLEIQPVQSSGA